MNTAARPAIRPFWERMSDFFTRPFHLKHLLWLIALSLASLVSVVVPDIFMVVVQGIIWLAGVRHAFTAMDFAARGYFDVADEDSLALRDDPERVNLPWKMVGIVFFCVGTLVLLSKFSPPLARIGVWCLPLAMPAITMQLSASNSLAESLRPGRWWHFIAGIGGPYLILCLFLWLLSNGMPMALAMLLPRVGEVLALPVLNFVGLYFLLVSFLLMGYTMYQYNEPLGLVADAEAYSFKPENPKAVFEREIGALIGQGKMAEAQAMADQALRDDPHDWAAQERVYKLLLLQGASERWIDRAHDLLARCLSAQRDARALEVYQDLTRHGQAVALNAQHTLALAQAADKAHETALAVQLIKGFDKRFPNNTVLPEVYFLSARIASERLRRHDQAKALLQTILSRYPQHPVAAQAQVYLKVLNQMPA